jgi:hypothetical protein
LNGTSLEEKCKIYNNTCKFKCWTFTSEESCIDDDCFWLYNESEGEEGTCKEKDDSNFICDELQRESQCALSNVYNLELNCLWVKRDKYEKCIKTEITCNELPGFLCEEYEKGSEDITGLNVIDSWCFVNDEKKENGLCVSHKIFVDDCNVIRNKRVCENADELFDFKYGCSWVKEDDGKEHCIESEKSGECSDFTTLKECLESSEHFCSWVKIGNYYSCVLEKSAELCEYYMDVNGCSETIGRDRCTWNLTVGKCLGASKSCEEYDSYNKCKSVSDKCFWNGADSSKNGRCVSLEEVYTCNNLSMTICKTYDSIEGLTLDINPCFYNNVFDEGFYCVSAESVMNTKCENIKTNEKVGVKKTPKYCDNAQLLFNISGKNGFGCKWDENECVDVILEEKDLPDNCSIYTNVDDCNYHMISDKSTCFWNPTESKEDENLCMKIGDVKTCEDICSNDISGINTHFCSGNIMNSRSEMCKWEEITGEENDSYSCNCKSVDIPESCRLVNISSPSECNQFISLKGKCFYNGDNIDNVKWCFDIVDIEECENFQNQTACTYAKKHTYKNLEPYSSVPSTALLCYWNAEVGECRSKKLSNTINEEEKNSLLVMIIIIITSVGVVSLVVVIVIVVIVIKKRKSKRDINEIYEMYGLNSYDSTDNNHASSLYPFCLYI